MFLDEEKLINYILDRLDDIEDLQMSEDSNVGRRILSGKLDAFEEMLECVRAGDFD